MKKYLLASFVFLLFACEKQLLTDPQQIVDKAIEAHGGDNYEDVSFEFDFRGRHYIFQKDRGRYTYTRVTQDSIGEIKDVLINSAKFKRYLNDKEVIISKERQEALTSSVNSVLYFAQLPFPLNDGAVNKEFIGMATVEGNEYYKVGVTFDQIGGGEDFEDIFCYWINANTFTVDYIAYSYAEKDGIGTRFRKAINRSTIEGITFQDYINYKPKVESGSSEVHNHDQLFEQGQLEELSRIENTNIQIIKPIITS